MISVCMATYNGARFIARQLESITAQLSETDEVVIVDDCSSDATVDIIKEIKEQAACEVRIYQNEQNLGPVKNFEKALRLSKGEYLFLSDQDDSWHSNKVMKVMKAFKGGADLVLHDGTVLDGKGKIIDDSWIHYNHLNPQQGVVGNLIKNGYTGAMMAFTRKLLDLASPFPEKIEMHDQWLFLVAKKNHLKITIIPDSLMNYVRHGDNVTGMHKRALREMLSGRWRMVQYYQRLKREK